MLLGHHFPAVMWLLVPFAVCVAASRVVLGALYPTDLVAGAAVGWALALVSLGVVSGFGP